MPMLRSALTLLAALGVTAPACAERDFDELLKSHYIHCAFFRNTGTLENSQDERKAQILVHYHGIDKKGESARMISTDSSGARKVRVIRTEHAVHFIEDSVGLFVMTTVFGCNERDRRPGKHHCITYGATNLRLFDTTVLSQPDKVFETYKHLANHGFCDHSFFGAAQ